LLETDSTRAPMNSSYNILQFGLISCSQRTHEDYVCNKRGLDFTRDKHSRFTEIGQRPIEEWKLGFDGSLK
jgi:hypothetical protein